MAAKTPARRNLASTVARIAQDNPEDPRLPGLRNQLDHLAVTEIGEWAQRAAAALPPLGHEEIAAVARQAARIDTRIARRSGDADAG